MTKTDSRGHKSNLGHKIKSSLFWQKIFKTCPQCLESNFCQKIKSPIFCFGSNSKSHFFDKKMTNTEPQRPRFDLKSKNWKLNLSTPNVKKSILEAPQIDFSWRKWEFTFSTNEEWLKFCLDRQRSIFGQKIRCSIFRTKMIKNRGYI